jgi:hypothetical protein
MTTQTERNDMPEDLPATKPFAAFLREQRRGLLHAELSDALAAVVAGVVKHGKTGKLTVTFTIKPEGDEAITIADTYAAKVPTPPASASLFFADEYGHFSRQRINQIELPLRGIDGAKTATDEPEAATP